MTAPVSKHRDGGMTSLDCRVCGDTFLGEHDDTTCGICAAKEDDLFPVAIDVRRRSIQLHQDGRIEVFVPTLGEWVDDSTNPTWAEAFVEFLLSPACDAKDRPDIAAAILREPKGGSVFAWSKEDRANLVTIARAGGYEPCVSCGTIVDTEDRPLDREGQATCEGCYARTERNALRTVKP